MRKSSFLITLLFFVILIAVVWRWHSTNSRSTSHPVPTISTPPIVQSAATGGRTEPDSGPAQPLSIPPPAPVGLPSVSDTLGAPSDDLVLVAKNLSTIVRDPRQPMSERTEALAHALNLSVGNEVTVLLPLVQNADLPSVLTETVLDEMLNRSLRIQAELYLKALGAQKNPALLTKIRAHLAFLNNDVDLGADPSAWTNALDAARATWPE